MSHIKIILKGNDELKHLNFVAPAAPERVDVTIDLERHLPQLPLLADINQTQ